MKKLSLMMILIFTFSLFLCSAASADVITALAIEVNPEHLEKTASYARILGYNEESNTLTVELIAPEVFAREDVLSLQVGDSIYTGGKEVEIESISPKDVCGVVVFNGGDLFLFENHQDNCYNMMADEDDYVWSSIAVLECPVTNSLLFLDYVDEETGSSRSLPAVYSARELTAKILADQNAADYSIGYACNNIYVVFNEAGQLATIQRFYVPWQ